MNHKEFINELAKYGIIVKPTSYNVYDWCIEINKERIDSDKYKPFGYFCGGTYAPVSPIERTYEQSDIIEAVKAFAVFQANIISACRYDLSYWDIKDYLKQYPAKSKVLKDGIDRVVEILKEDFNTMLRWKHKK